MVNCSRSKLARFTSVAVEVVGAAAAATTVIVLVVMPPPPPAVVIVAAAAVVLILELSLVEVISLVVYQRHYVVCQDSESVLINPRVSVKRHHDANKHDVIVQVQTA